MTWARWVQDLLDGLKAPSSWSPARQRAEAEWARIWCPPGSIKVGERFVSVERRRRLKWQQEEAAAA